MTVLNTLILHLKSFKGLGRKKIFPLINDNINIEEITSSKVDIKKILDEQDEEPIDDNSVTTNIEELMKLVNVTTKWKF